MGQAAGMSYQVLARKWRPVDFSQVAGQEHVLKTLVNALDNQRLHHAYLFTGTRGTGKTTLARILAKVLQLRAGHQFETVQFLRRLYRNQRRPPSRSV